MMTKRRVDAIKFAGVRFRFGKLTWQDAFSSYRVSPEQLAECITKRTFPQRETYGYFARVGNVAVMLKEIGATAEDADITLVPLAAQVRFEPR